MTPPRRTKREPNHELLDKVVQEIVEYEKQKDKPEEKEQQASK